MLAVGSDNMDFKRIKISGKSQITIPKVFKEKLNLNNEVICFIRGNELVIKSVDDESDFSDLILKELIDKGLSGQVLFEEFCKYKTKVKTAIGNMIDEAEEKAKTLEDNENKEMEDIFGDGDN